MIKISSPQIGREEEAAVLEVLRGGQLSQGQEVDQFEEDFKAYLGIKYAAAVNSGTSALMLGCQALGLKTGDEVITTPFSFIASSTAIIYTGATPVWVDINRDFNLDPNRIEEKITPQTKAILVVHLYGNPANMTAINKIARKHHLKVIEDAAQAHGSKIDNRFVGTMSDIACFSFYPTKNMTTVEGGMVVSNNRFLIEKVKLLRTYGSTKRYYHSLISYNFRLSNLMAAIGSAQLKKLDRFNLARNQNASYLSNQLADLKYIETPLVKTGNYSCFHQYTIRIKKPFKRGRVANELKKRGIETAVYYPRIIPKQKALGYLEVKETFPEAEKASREVLSLPIHPQLTKNNLDTIARAIKEIAN